MLKSELRTILLPALIFFAACSDFLQPVESTPTPTEFEYNYWLLQRTYLFEDELPNLDPEGDSVQTLYEALKDPYTRYVPPSKSEAVSISINTSIVEGDVGMEYMLLANSLYPIFTYRVYPDGPAGRAGIPRYGNIRSVNGVELTGDDAFATYNAILDTSAQVELVIYRDSTETTYNITKETVYAPTVFVDTLNSVIFVTITEFKLNTADKDSGTVGELKAYLDSTQNEKSTRVINISKNPGGHVSQCVRAADMFVSQGTLSTREWRTFAPDGKNAYKKLSMEAVKGDPGEKGKFVILASGGSASCAEIFAASVSELTDTPILGKTTFGKGIGQTNWKTIAGGLAIITNLEFKTPKGNSYHKKGIVPDYECDGDMVLCVSDFVKSKSGALAKPGKTPEDLSPFSIIERNPNVGGAILQQNELE